MKRRSGDMFLRSNGAIFLCVTQKIGFYVVTVKDSDQGKEITASIDRALDTTVHLKASLCDELAYIGNLGDILERTAEKQRLNYEDIREKFNQDS